ncbi:hypothetical protein [Streptomyces sp. NBS 14/10]|uniref:hypothetical protein n=1 Tax=Streptomyces sp. NBS 14/10 TaxID=1945643 RepID=UPI0026AFEBAB
MTEADDTAKRRRKASPASPVVRRSVTLAESVGELSGPLAQQENSATASEDTMSESNGEATTPATTAATVDPAPPEFAVVGQWRSDDDGEVVEWQANEDCVPSPGARGRPEPTDDVDRVIRLAATGYGPAVVPIYTSPRYLHRTGTLGFEQTDGVERAEAVQAEATSAGAREERGERGGQA